MSASLKDPGTAPLSCVVVYNWPFPRPDKEVLRVNDTAFVTESTQRAVTFIENERREEIRHSTTAPAVTQAGNGVQV